MKLQMDTLALDPVRARRAELPSAYVAGETDVLTDVVLCQPHHLAAVPCCAVTRHSLAQGFTARTAVALEQHRKLVEVLKAEGVRCHMIAPEPSLPDMCFTRDIAVSTPFGLRLLNPAMPHRRGEADAFAKACHRWGQTVSGVAAGTIEGGDICVAREGLLIVGMSGERSSQAGVEHFAAPFRAAGWDVIVCPFDADHLHLDTIFCMVSDDEAIGCVELLHPDFLGAVEAQGIRILPVSSEAPRTLACNILSLGRRRIVASTASDEVVTTLRRAGYAVTTVDVSEFAACGGGVHCLTMPLRRVR